MGSSPQVVDWNSDGQVDLVSGDREGYFNVFIRADTNLRAFYRYRLLDSTILDVGNNSQPAVADWNGDGKKDLLLGTEAGYIHFYPNLASDTWPMFQTYTYIEAAGSPIYLYRVNPYVFDLDLDGRQDMLCGANDGYVHFYRNIGTNANPVLQAPETLRLQDGTPIRPIGAYPYGSRCGFGDWNNDGWPDFLLSGYDGYVQLHLGLPFTAVEEQVESGRLPPTVSAIRLTGRSMTLRIAGLKQGQRVQVVDLTGRTVASLRSEKEGEVAWAGAVPAGVYFCYGWGGSGRDSSRALLKVMAVH